MNKVGKALFVTGSVMLIIFSVLLFIFYGIVDLTAYQNNDISVINVAGIITGISVGTVLLIICKIFDKLLPSIKK